MNAVPQRSARRIVSLIGSLHLLWVTLTLPCLASPYGRSGEKPMPSTVKVSLSEWKVQLAPTRVPPGPVIFEVTDAGTIPHAFEIEGRGLERSTPQIEPGASATLKLDLRAGSYEAYCPVGKGSHKMLGMMNHLVVGNAKRPAASDERERDEKQAAGRESAENDGDHIHDEEHGGAMMMKVAGGGPVIQILP